jgi:hypothetical protein
VEAVGLARDQVMEEGEPFLIMLPIHLCSYVNECGAAFSRHCVSFIWNGMYVGLGVGEKGADVHLLRFKYVIQIKSSGVSCVFYGAFQFKRDALWPQHA